MFAALLFQTDACTWACECNVSSRKHEREYRNMPKLWRLKWSPWGSVTRPCPFPVTGYRHDRAPSPTWYMMEDITQLQWRALVYHTTCSNPKSDITYRACCVQFSYSVNKIIFSPISLVYMISLIWRQIVMEYDAETIPKTGTKMAWFSFRYEAETIPTTGTETTRLRCGYYAETIPKTGTETARLRCG